MDHPPQLFSHIRSSRIYHIEDGTVRDDVYFVESRFTAHIQASVIENRIECNKSDDWEGGGDGKGRAGRNCTVIRVTMFNYFGILFIITCKLGALVYILA